MYEGQSSLSLSPLPLPPPPTGLLPDISESSVEACQGRYNSPRMADRITGEPPFPAEFHVADCCEVFLPICLSSALLNQAPSYTSPSLPSSLPHFPLPPSFPPALSPSLLARSGYVTAIGTQAAGSTWSAASSLCTMRLRAIAELT